MKNLHFIDKTTNAEFYSKKAHCSVEYQSEQAHKGTRTWPECFYFAQYLEECDGILVEDLTNEDIIILKMSGKYIKQVIDSDSVSSATMSSLNACRRKNNLQE